MRPLETERELRLEQRVDRLLGSTFFLYTKPLHLLQRLCEAIILAGDEIRSIHIKSEGKPVASAVDVHFRDNLEARTAEVVLTDTAIEIDSSCPDDIKKQLQKCLDHFVKPRLPLANGAAEPRFPVDAGELLKEYLVALRQALADVVKEQQCNAGFQVFHENSLWYLHVEGGLSPAGMVDAQDPIRCLTNILNSACRRSGTPVTFSKYENLDDLIAQLSTVEAEQLDGLSRSIAALIREWRDRISNGQFSNFLKALLTLVPQRYKYGFAYDVIECRAPAYYKDLGSVRPRKDAVPSWSYALMTAVESRFGLGGLELTQNGVLYRETCWMVVVPSFHYNILQGFAYASGTYYLSGDEIYVHNQGHLHSQGSRTTYEKYLDEELPKLARTLWHWADVFGAIVHDAQELKCLREIAGQIQRSPSQEEFRRGVARTLPKFFAPAPGAELKDVTLDVTLWKGVSVQVPPGGETIVKLTASRADTLQDTVATVRRRTIEGGTRSAITALATRNLAHNLGSHVLRWFEMDAAEWIRRIQATTPSLGSPDQTVTLSEWLEHSRNLFAYLAERMELATAFAVYLPTWLARIRIEELGYLAVGVLDTIGRAEGVEHIHLSVTHRDPNEREVALPGGRLGLQAFYGIVENIARDAAKYGRLEPAVVCVIGASGVVTVYSEESEPLLTLRAGPDWMSPLLPELKRLKWSWPNRRLDVFVLESASPYAGKGCRVDLDSGKERDLIAGLVPSGPSRVTVWNVRAAELCGHAKCRTIRQSFTSITDNQLSDNDDRRSQICHLRRCFLHISVELSRSDTWHDSLIAVAITDDRITPRISDVRARVMAVKTQGLCEQVTGMLEPGDWGIKERYIFAGFLRAERVTALLTPADPRPTAQEDETPRPPILTVPERMDGRLSWELFLLKPKDVLVVTEHAVPQSPGIDVWTWQQLRERLPSAAIRHRFVVLCPAPGPITALEDILDALPYRVFIQASEHARLSELKQALYAPLAETDLRNLSSASLYDRWIDFLASAKTAFTELHVSHATKLRKLETFGEHIVSYVDSPQLPSRVGYALYDRHAQALTPNTQTYKQYHSLLNDSTVPFHYEPYVQSWGVCRWIEQSDRSLVCKHTAEAAIVKILLLDERNARMGDQLCTDIPGISLKQLWAYKGIVVSAKDDQPSIEELVAPTEAGSRFAFVLLHQGILDKIYERGLMQETKEACFARILRTVRERGRCRVVVHSGRGCVPTLLPTGVKFLHHSSMEAWLSGNVSKIDILEELMSLRRSES